jgi:hypothetical protein
MTDLTEETAKELMWAIRGLTDAINDYARVKQRGIRLAETIEDERASRVYVHEW